MTEHYVLKVNQMTTQGTKYFHMVPRHIPGIYAVFHPQKRNVLGYLRCEYVGASIDLRNRLLQQNRYMFRILVKREASLLVLAIPTPCISVNQPWQSARSVLEAIEATVMDRFQPSRNIHKMKCRNAWDLCNRFGQTEMAEHVVRCIEGYVK